MARFFLEIGRKGVMKSDTFHGISSEVKRFDISLLYIIDSYKFSFVKGVSRTPEACMETKVKIRIPDDTALRVAGHAVATAHMREHAMVADKPSARSQGECRVMKTNKTTLHWISILMVFIMALLVTGCKTDAVNKRAENEEKLLKAITEYPGDGLYDPEMTVIGLDAPEPTEEELAEAEKKAAEEKEKWQKAVGDCFADGMFDTFYKEWFRIDFLGLSQAKGLTTTITKFSIEDDAAQDQDNIEHALITFTATDEEGGTKSFDMDWQVIFDKDDPGLLQKIELKDDGGFWEAYQEP